MGPLAIAGIGASLLGGIFGSKAKQGVPDWLIDMIKSEYQSSRTSGFLPDESVYNAKISADTSEIMGQLPVAQENFNADAASRGVFSSGEAMTKLYSDVYKPIASAALSSAANTRLKFQEMTMQAKQAQAQQRMQWMNLLTSALLNKQPSALQSGMDWLGNAGEMVATYGIGQDLGIFGSGSGSTGGQEYA